MHPSYNGYAVLGTLKIVNLILSTFWTYARSIPILLSISASLLNGYGMVKDIINIIIIYTKEMWNIEVVVIQRWNSTGNIFKKIRKAITASLILHYPMTFIFYT